MLKGQAAFRGDSVPDVLAAVLRSDPDVASVPAPPRIRQVLARCLQKDLRQRFQHMGDVRLALEGAFDLPPSFATEPSRLAVWKRVALVTAAMMVLTAAGVVFALFGRRPGLVKAVWFSFELPVDARPGVTVQPVAISPDSSRIFVVVETPGEPGPPQRRLMVRERERPELTPIPTGAGLIGSIFLSPDGRWIGYADAQDGTFKKVQVSGGPPSTRWTGAGANSFLGANWGPNQTIVFATTRTRGLMELPEGGGEPAPLTAAADGEFHQEPHFLPDGRTVLFTIRRSQQPDRIAVLTPSREMRMLLDGSSPRYMPTGHLVFVRGAALWAVPFDLARLQMTGDPVAVLEGVSLGTSIFRLAQFDVAADGSLAYVPAAGRFQERSLVVVDAMGNEHQLDAPPHAYFRVRFSPDGSRVAVDAQVGDRDVWIWDGFRLAKLTSGSASDRGPVWTPPDGRYVVFGSDRDGAFGLYRQAADLTGGIERLPDTASALFPTSFSPDGSQLIYIAESTSTGQDLKMLVLTDPPLAETLVATPAAERDGQISPDGRWLAYESSDEFGTSEIIVRPFPHVQAGRTQVSTKGGRAPRWGGNGTSCSMWIPRDG
jgi:WD40 repeat protein